MYSFGEQVRITEKSDWSESVFSQPNLFQHRVCNLNNEALKNEMDWLSWKIESEVKKVNNNSCGLKTAYKWKQYFYNF